MKKTLQRGFTLIELLVVIAIIGILAAVVLASLNDARDSGQDASLKQSLGNARSQAELFYNSNGYTYDGVCDDGSVASLMGAAMDQRAETTSTTTDAVSDGDQVTCNDGDGGYAIIAPLNVTTNSEAWCVDATGFAGGVAEGALSATDDVTCQ